MARYEFKLPDIGEGVTEGEIVGWLVQPGDVVKDDQPIVEVMTDKATVTITAPKAGIVVETRGKVGETVPIHTVLVVFEVPAAPPVPRANGTTPHGTTSRTTRPPAPPAAGASSGATAVGELQETLAGMLPPEISPRTASGKGYFNGKPLATPFTRKFARDMNVDLRRVPPTGSQGRVTRSDVESFAGMDPAEAAPDPSVRGSAAAGAALPGSRDTEPSRAIASEPGEERIPIAGLRRRIAQKMSRSTSTAAHFTFVEECDATELKSLRARLKDAAQAQGAKLSFLPFVVKAVVAALKKHPMLNTTVDEATNEIVFRKHYNIGIATATEAGLVVPVLRHADKMSILAIAREIERLAEDARAGRAKLDDLVGSTFTITSLGAKSGLMATPIINFPEVAILGVHQMKTKPVVKAGQIVIGDVMLLSLSFDHRIVDGHVGAAFAYDVIAYLEQPERLLLEMA